MATLTLSPTITPRQYEVTADFVRILDRHLADLVAGRAERLYEIRDIAGELNLHPTHLSNTIRQTTGQSPTSILEEKLMAVARKLLLETYQPIAQIAATLTFDPSNFTKFFKRFQGVTPRQFRDTTCRQVLAKSEVCTI